MENIKKKFLTMMQGWSISMLRKHCPDQFLAAVGMTVDEVAAALDRKDAKTFERLLRYGSDNAEELQKAFAGAGAPEEKQKHNKP